MVDTSTDTITTIAAAFKEDLNKWIKVKEQQGYEDPIKHWVPQDYFKGLLTITNNENIICVVTVDGVFGVLEQPWTVAYEEEPEAAETLVDEFDALLQRYSETYDSCVLFIVYRPNWWPQTTMEESRFKTDLGRWAREKQKEGFRGDIQLRRGSHFAHNIPTTSWTVVCVMVPSGEFDTCRGLKRLQQLRVGFSELLDSYQYRCMISASYPQLRFIVRKPSA